VRLVALVVGLAVMAVIAVVVISAMNNQTEDTLAVLTTTTVEALQPGLPRPGGQPLPLETAPSAVAPGVPPVVAAATLAACTAEKATQQAAMDTYAAMQGSPPADEQALVDAGVIREVSKLWAIKDGVLAALNPGCA
jgi:hypothetical protein